MSRHTYPWMKLQKDTKRDPAIVRLTLEQQAVFYNLLQHAGLQEEEGAFDANDREALALEVAQEQVDILNATIERLVKYRVLTTLPNGRFGFTSYEKHQATSKDVNAARQRRFYDAHKSQVTDAQDGSLTHPNADLTLSNGDSPSISLSTTTESINAREEHRLVDTPATYEPDMHHPVTGPTVDVEPEDEAERVMNVLVAELHERRGAYKVKAIRHAIDKCKDTDPIDALGFYLRNQLDLPREKRRKDHVGGFVLELGFRQEKGWSPRVIASPRAQRKPQLTVVTPDLPDWMREAYKPVEPDEASTA